MSVARLRNVESSSTVLAGLKLTPSCFFSVHRVDRKTTFIFVKRRCCTCSTRLFSSECWCPAHWRAFISASGCVHRRMVQWTGKGVAVSWFWVAFLLLIFSPSTKSKQLLYNSRNGDGLDSTRRCPSLRPPTNCFPPSLSIHCPFFFFSLQAVKRVLSNNTLSKCTTVFYSYYGDYC